jgi:hypothetical protein
MDSNKSLAFQFDSIKQINELNDDWEIMLYIEADFFVLVDSKVLYSEQYFCVVEFASALFRWLDKVDKTEEDFIYESMDSDEVGLVWIKQNESGWRVGSVHQNYEEARTFNLDEIKEACKKIFYDLNNELSAKFKIDLYNFLFRQTNAFK